MQDSQLRSIRSLVGQIPTGLYTTDPEDMRQVVVTLMDLTYHLANAVLEHEDLGERLSYVEADLEDTKQDINTLNVSMLDLEAISRDYLHAKTGPQGKQGPKGDHGPIHAIDQNPMYLEQIERIKDLEDQVEELTAAIEELEK